MTYFKIYRIVDNTNDNVYIGSTKQRLLSKRISRHREDSNTCSSKMIIQNQDYFYEIVEVCNIDNIKEKERFYINNTDNCINKNKLNGYDKDKCRLNARLYAKRKRDFTKNCDGLNLITDIFF